MSIGGIAPDAGPTSDSGDAAPDGADATTNDADADATTNDADADATTNDADADASTNDADADASTNDADADASTNDADADASTNDADADSAANSSDADASDGPYDSGPPQAWTSCADLMDPIYANYLECCGGIWTPASYLWSGVACSAPSNTQCFDFEPEGTSEFGWMSCCDGVWGPGYGSADPLCPEPGTLPWNEDGGLLKLREMLGAADAGYACTEASPPDSCCSHVACIESDSGACPAWPDAVPSIAQEHAAVWGSCACVGGSIGGSGPYDPASAPSYVETPADAVGTCCYIVDARFCQ